jgi:hypothetical protein
MVTQIKPVLCPKCRKPVLGIDRVPVPQRRDLAEVEVFHLVASDKPCRIKMTWKDSQELANNVSRDIWGRK